MTENLDSRNLLTRIHVNQHRIKANVKHGSTLPVLTVKTYKDNRYAHQAILRDSSGTEMARIIYRPDRPLSCGARCWIETRCDVEVLDE